MLPFYIVRTILSRTGEAPKLMTETFYGRLASAAHHWATSCDSQAWDAIPSVAHHQHQRDGAIFKSIIATFKNLAVTLTVVQDANDQEATWPLPVVETPLNAPNNWS